MAACLAVFCGLAPLSAASAPLADSPETAFARLHRDAVAPISKDKMVPKAIFAIGAMDAFYLGLNELVQPLQIARDNGDPRQIALALQFVKFGLEGKPDQMRHLSAILRDCESYPGFPLGFADGPEGPEPISRELDKIGAAIENVNINAGLTDPTALNKEADRVIFALFWTAGEMVRALTIDIYNWLRVTIKVDLGFTLMTKKPARAPVVR